MYINVAKVKRLMFENRFSVQALADASGISLPTAYRILYGRSISLTVARKAAQALGVKPIEIVEDDND